MQSSRRAFIRVLGGGVIGAALPLLPGCATQTMPEEAVRIWRAAPPPETELRRWAVSHALLAPNPHNLQPWLIDLRTPEQITLRYDPERKLPETDPYFRQLIIGCGAFVELLVQALHERGRATDVRYFPEGEPADGMDGREVATVSLIAGEVVRDPLFAQVRRRWTHRMPFDVNRPVAPDVLNALTGVSGSTSVVARSAGQSHSVQQLRDIASRAWEIELRTPRTWLESVKLSRVGPEAIRQHRDGISLLNLPRGGGDITDPRSRAFQGALGFGAAQAQSAMAWVWWVTDGNSRSAQLDAGRAFVRAHLKATELGAAFHPMSQVLQEYPQMRAAQADLYRFLEIDPARSTVQMLARIGYAQGAYPSPRRDLDTMLVS